MQSRGAGANPTGRYEALVLEPFDDGWEAADEDKLRTTVEAEQAKSIITTNQSPDIPYDQSINPYRGCEHGCIYCYARANHAFVGLSSGLDFETRLFAKYDAADLLRSEFTKPRYQPKPIMIGSNTDPYQPIERDLELTRKLLEVMRDCKHPVGITTRSAGILRDLDILGPMAKQGLATVAISVTTLDRDLARRMEPRAPTPPRRLETIRALTDAGVPVIVLVAPLIPAINMHEVERILDAVKDAGAKAADYIALRLPRDLDGLLEGWLENHYPDRKSHVLNGVRAMRGGELNISDFGTRFTGLGEEAKLLAQRFRLTCKKLGLDQHRHSITHLRTDLFERPLAKGNQLALF